MMPKFSFIGKSRLIIVLSVGLFVLGIFSLVYVQSLYTDKIVGESIEEAEHDLKFFSKLIKKSYLKSDFVEVENILNNWVSDNKLDYKVSAVADNGFELFSWSSDKPASHTKKVSYEIMHEGRVLLTLALERDLSSVTLEAEQERKKYLILGLIFAVAFGSLIWFLLDKFAFLPLQQEISRRHTAEENLLDINDELEKRVEKRTSDIIKLSGVVEQTDDIVVITDPYGTIEYVNPAFEKITGYLSAETIGKKTSFIKSGMHEDSFYKKLWGTIIAGDSFREVFINRKRNGDLYYEEKTITPLKDKKGEIQNYVSTGKDISDRMEIQDRLHHMATHDALTDLPNRLMVNDRLEHAIQKVERSDVKIAVMFIDLDRFKQVNDSLGHASGDSLLKVIAVKLKSHLRKGDTLARFGGDEFVVLIEDYNQIEDVMAVLHKMLEAVVEPVLISGYEISSSASIGVTIFPDDATNVDALLKNADVAMYRAKDRGGNNFQFYTQDMSAHADERMELQHGLNHALERDEFKLYYQPRINVQSGRVVGMEALLRWEHSTKGLLEPLTFIPILEETGKIIEAGHWILRKACTFNAELERKGLGPLRVSVNLSARQFHDEQLLQCIEDIRTKNNFNTAGLEVEITESLLIENVDSAVAILDELHEAGIHIAIDDFGTGYSSMSYLKRFPIDLLKIDKSFVNDIPDDKDDVAIVRAIVALGETMGMNLVAEGVETEEQLQFFREVDHCEIQGFYISKPMPEEEFVTWIINYNKKVEDSIAIY
jgi:diguanylate cyclase (GGDEF)-like protein/PAS domain S-box-containing protein